MFHSEWMLKYFLFALPASMIIGGLSSTGKISSLWTVILVGCLIAIPFVLCATWICIGIYTDRARQKNQPARIKEQEKDHD